MLQNKLCQTVACTLLDNIQCSVCVCVCVSARGHVRVCEGTGLSQVSRPSPCDVHILPPHGSATAP